MRRQACYEALELLALSPPAIAIDGRHLFNEMRTRRCGLKTISEILCFPGYQSFPKFHDAHRVGWSAVIRKYEFGDPEITAADNSLDRKTLFVGLDESALLNIIPP